MRIKTPTQKDIAKRLVVSQSLVAGVLSGNPKCGVSETTRRRVLEAAREMGYIPNAASRMLRTGKSTNVILASINPVHTEVREAAGERAFGGLAGIVGPMAEEVGRLGYKVEIKTAPDVVTLGGWLEESVRSRSCDAIFLWCKDAETEILGTALERFGKPFVVRGHHEQTHPHWVQAEYDHEGIIRQSVDWLASLGHTRIGYLGHGTATSYVLPYRHGFDKAMIERFGRPAPESWILTSHETIDSALQIEAQIEGWMTMPESERPTAIACGQGGSVLSRIEMILLRHGLIIGEEPGHFGLTGFIFKWEDRLLAGRARGILSESEPQMIRRIAREQLIPLAEGREPEHRILRFLPGLWPMMDPILTERMARAVHASFREP